MGQITPMTPEWRLLLACARVRPDEEVRAAIRQSRFDEIDWTLFARLATEHGLAALAGHALISIVPERVPGDIILAFRANIDDTQRRNRASLVELARIIESLKSVGVEPIPLRGPVLALQAYEDLGLRLFRGLELIVRDTEFKPTIAALGRLGYEREHRLSTAQLDLMARLRGGEPLSGKGRAISLAVHTRLAPITMALDIDYAGLWHRAQRTTLRGVTVEALAPEDNLLMLAVHGGNELWRRLSWACDISAFIDSHPALDWVALRERASAQGCLRMVLLATALARRLFGGAAPRAIGPAERADRAIERMLQRITEQWLTGEAVSALRGMGPLDRLRLHDEPARRLAHVARISVLPAPHHVRRIRLPRALTSLPAYVPLKLAQDLALLPLLGVYRNVRAGSQRLRERVANTQFALAMMPASLEAKRIAAQHQRVRADAMRALAANPNNAEAWHHLGNALCGLRRYEEAIGCYDRALVLVPDRAVIWKDRGAAARAGKLKTVPSDIEDERTLDGADANAWARRAGFLAASQRFAEAAAASDRALARDPNHLIAMRIGIRSRITACDWRRREEDKRRITEGLRAGLRMIPPFDHRAICESDAEHLVVARLFARHFPRPTPLWRGEVYRHERIRVAYLSSEFKRHPTAILIAGVLEHHDRTRFETIACSFGPEDGSEIRRRIKAAMDHFIEAQTMSDAQVAAKLREMEIDIAIDLNGHAGAGRTAILAHRPCPVQVNYLGNAGTMGAPFLDYIIADRTVIPSDQFPNYTEKVVHLPHSYQCNDSRRAAPHPAPSRVDAGLPETGFVYCCFNRTYKIAPEVFTVWMRLLKASPGSVLWLLGDTADSMHNLRREAATRGVAPERLTFAPVMTEEDHLARLGLADVFLDTLPVNGHATASDALWAGLPVLTCIGSTFGGRVAASLLRALDLPELVTSSLAEYEELALALARDHERLAAIKAKLVRNRAAEPLFDTARYTRDLETAYRVMAERSRRGERPASFCVATGGVPQRGLEV